VEVIGPPVLRATMAATLAAMSKRYRSVLKRRR
jgi:hypothetical protein